MRAVRSCNGVSSVLGIQRTGMTSQRAICNAVIAQAHRHRQHAAVAFWRRAGNESHEWAYRRRRGRKKAVECCSRRSVAPILPIRQRTRGLVQPRIPLMGVNDCGCLFPGPERMQRAPRGNKDQRATSARAPHRAHAHPRERARRNERSEKACSVSARLFIIL